MSKGTHEGFCSKYHPQCPCLICAKDSCGGAVCCVDRRKDCEATTCKEHEPESEEPENVNEKDH